MLKVGRLGKSYRVFDSPRGRLKYLLFPRSAQFRVHTALADVSFELDRGQCLGVVGDNGAGKSTLLKLIAGTLSPTTGSVQREGRLTAILELGAGFHPEFTGRQNIHFAGALIGIDADEMMRREPEIIAFSEIGEAIDRPVKTYSSGMVVRLAFALVTAVDPEILVIDEALAVGDQHFQKKCIERIETFRNKGCTILFCSHSLYHVRHLCDRAVWIDGGRVRAIGDTEMVLTRYEAHVREQDRAQQVSMPEATPASAEGTAVSRSGDGAEVGRARLISVSLDGIGSPTTPGEPGNLQGTDLVVTLIAEMPGDEQPALAILLERSDGVGITAVGTHADSFTPSRLPDGRWRACVRFPDIPLYSGEYVVSGYLFDAKGVIVYDEWRHCERFMHVFPTLETGIVRLAHEWS